MDDQRGYEEEERVPEHSGTSHALAIGFYIAAVILIFGTILVLYGILGPESQTEKSLGRNINLWWGLFMVAFGCVVLGISWASPAAGPPATAPDAVRKEQETKEDGRYIIFYSFDDEEEDD